MSLIATTFSPYRQYGCYLLSEEDLLQADGEAQLLGAKEVYAMTKCELYGRRNELLGNKFQIQSVTFRFSFCWPSRFEPLFVKVVIVGFNKEP